MTTLIRDQYCRTICLNSCYMLWLIVSRPPPITRQALPSPSRGAMVIRQNCQRRTGNYLLRLSSPLYQLKTPYRDGTTHVIFEPLDFMARLAALVPRPRVNLTRYHGVFAPNSPWRGAITPGRRGKGAQRQASDEVEEDTPAARRSAMIWAQRLKRVFRIDVETCQACGGAMKIIASIEDPYMDSSSFASTLC